MITKVQKLTRMNVGALKDVRLGWELGTTYAAFVGTPTEALRQLEDVMATFAGSGTTYRSLSAVRRKLGAAKAAYSQLSVAKLPIGITQVTDYVQVRREASDGPLEVTI